MSHTDPNDVSTTPFPGTPGLPLLFCGFAAGLLTASFLPPWPILPPLALAAGTLWLVFRNRIPPVPWLPLLLFFCLGAALYHLHLQPPGSPLHIGAFADKGPVTVQGTVSSVVPRVNQGCRIDMEVSEIFSGSSFRPARGQLRLFVEQAPSPPDPGERIRFSARPKRPQLFGTPGEFDYPRHLASQGIFATAFLENTDAVVRFAPQDRGRLPAGIARFRQETGRRIDRAVDPALAPLVRALVIGDKGRLTPEQTDLLARAGISHLFAISGLHLGLVALLLFGLTHHLYRFSERLLLFQPAERLLPLLLLPFLWTYLQVTGNALSARRAFLMALIAAVLLPSSRRTPPIRILLCVAFVMLCWSPLSLFEPSFQLSFAGLLGILIFLPRWQNRLQRLPRLLRWPAGIAAATLAATISTLPLVLMHFHLLAPAGLLTNLLSVPLIGFGAVPAGLAGMIAGTFLPEAGSILFQISGWFTALAWRLCRFAVSFSPLSGKMVYLSPMLLAAVFCAVAALLLPPGRRFRTGCLGLAGAMLLLAFMPFSSGTLTVTVLSVGQGDALLLTRPDGRHYLIDGGGSHRDTFDTGARLVAPALGRLGVRSLEAVILTHDHPDHRQGLIHILDHFPVKSFWCAEKLEKVNPELLGPLTRHGIELKTFASGWSFPDPSEDGSSLAVFVPDQPEDRLNDRSLVLHARYGRDGILLTGDLEKPGVEELLARTADVSVSLLKLPHHGSRHSSPELLTDRFRPRFVFASQGRNNPYGLPHAEVLDNLRERGLTLYRTDLHGTMRFESQGAGWRRAHWRDGLFH